MSCNINSNRKKNLRKALGLNAEDMNDAIEQMNQASVTDIWNGSFNAENIVQTTLNAQGLTYNGKEAHILTMEIKKPTNAAEVGNVILHLEVDGEYVKQTLDSGGYSKEISSMGRDAILSMVASAEFIVKATSDSASVAVEATNNPEVMAGMLEDAMEVDRDILPEDKALLDKSFNEILANLSSIMPKISVMLNEKGADGKMIEMQETLKDYVPIDSRNGEKSAYEILVHQLHYMAAAFTLESRDPEVAGVRKSMEDIRDAFFKDSRALDFLNMELGSKRTNEMLDMFADPEKGLYEFIAMSRSNPSMIKALGQMKTDDKQEVYPNMVSKIVGLIKKLFNFVMNTVLKRPTDNDYEKMAWLYDRMMGINKKMAIRKKDGLIAKFIGMLEKYDTALADRIEKETKKFASKPMSMPKTRLGRMLMLPRQIVRATYDKEMRKAVAMAWSFSGKSGTGALPQTLRHILESDKTSDFFQRLGMINQTGDTRREGIRQITTSKLKNAFSRKMNNEDFRALNVVTLSGYADIADKHELADLLDEKKLKAKIKEVEDKLNAISDKKEQNYYKFQINLLAEFMVNGTDHVMLLKNAHNIAARLNSVDSDKQVDPKKEELIDELASLKAFEITKKEDKSRLKEILAEEDAKGDNEVHGIEEVVYRLIAIRDQAREELFKEEDGVAQYIKGYVSDVYEENLDTKVASVKEEAQLKKEGYRLVMVLNNHKDDTSGVQALYVSNFPIKTRMHKTGLRYKNETAKGSSIMTSHFRDGLGNSFSQANRDVSKIRNSMYKKVREVENGTYKPDEDDNKLSPRYNSKGEVLDYNYTMDRDIKEKLLGAEINTFKIIGATAANTFDKAFTRDHNKEIYTKIVSEMTTNAPKYRGDKISGAKDNNVYVWIGPNSKSADRRELWSIFPQEGKNIFKDESGDSFSGFYIREDVLLNTLGFREPSIINAPIIRNLSNEAKYKLQIAEKIWTDIIRIYKGNVLLRIPEVLLMNVISNFNAVISYKVSPITAAKYKMNAVKDLNDYIELSKERIGLAYKVDSGRATADEVRRLKVIDNKMNLSSVKDLVDEGFYNQIMEDIEGDDTGNIVKDWLGKKMENAPAIVKNGAKWAFLTDTNPVVKFMEASTQYSDFVARYALYNILVKEKGKSKEEAIKTVRELFVNYTNANSPLIEWINKTGIVMFTKYFTNIQKAIVALAKGHPITFMLLLLGQEAVGDVPDITDASLLSKDLTNLFYNPINSVIGAATPGSYIMYDSIMR